VLLSKGSAMQRTRFVWCRHRFRGPRRTRYRLAQGSLISQANRKRAMSVHDNTICPIGRGRPSTVAAVRA
jgi:hypothetical protein